MIVRGFFVGLFLTFYAVAGTLLNACATQECHERLACSAGKVCYNNECQVICNDTAECGDGEVCNVGVCLAKEDVLGCGNGQLDEGEECDDGNVSNNDACLNNCQQATCGDGFIGNYEATDGQEIKEQCDLGKDLNGDDKSCTAVCVKARCGDSLKGPEESCDDGTRNSSEYAVTAHCNADCSGQAHFCGDSKVTDQETCDGRCETDVETCYSEFKPKLSWVASLAGESAMCNVACAYRARNCDGVGGNNDGLCPPGCSGNTDSDCGAPGLYRGKVFNLKVALKKGCFEADTTGCTASEAGTDLNESLWLSGIEVTLKAKPTGANATTFPNNGSLPTINQNKNVTDANGDYIIYNHLSATLESSEVFSLKGAEDEATIHSRGTVHTTRLVPEALGNNDTEAEQNLYYASKNWLAELVSQCTHGQNITLNSSAIVARVIDSAGKGAAGVPKYSISATLNNLEISQGQICFLDTENGEPMAQPDLDFSSSTGFYVVVNVLGSVGGAGALSVAPTDFEREFTFGSSQSLNVSSNDVAVFFSDGDKVVPSFEKKYDFKTDIYDEYMVKAGRSCNGCHIKQGAPASACRGAGEGNNTINLASSSLPFDGWCDNNTINIDTQAHHCGNNAAETLCIAGTYPPYWFDANGAANADLAYDNLLKPGTDCPADCKEREYVYYGSGDRDLRRICKNIPECSLLWQRAGIGKNGNHPGTNIGTDTTNDPFKAALFKWIEQGATRYSTIDLQKDLLDVGGDAGNGFLTAQGCVVCHASGAGNGSDWEVTGQKATFITQSLWPNQNGPAECPNGTPDGLVCKDKPLSSRLLQLVLRRIDANLGANPSCGDLEANVSEFYRLPTLSDLNSVPGLDKLIQWLGEGSRACAGNQECL